MSEAEKLTGKQRRFADLYLGEARFVGVKAAEMAQYRGNYSTLAAIASENLKKPNIKLYINERLDAITMPANVVLTRLTEIANGSVEDVLDEDGQFDFRSAKKNGKLPLLKKLKRKTTSKVVSKDEDAFEDESQTVETSIVFEEIEFEMYSAHEALRDLGKYHKLFTDRTEVTGKDGGPIETIPMTLDEWRAKADSRREEAAGTLEKFSEPTKPPSGEDDVQN